MGDFLHLDWEPAGVLARIRKRGFLVERRAGFAAVELGRGA